MEHRDLTEFYNTPLSPEEEKAFQLWASKRLGDLKDYDLRGAWKANSKEASNGHLPDTYKKPSHPTFSTDSIYNGVDGFYGGSWEGDDKTGWSYTPNSSQNLWYSKEELQNYFRDKEPNARLIYK